MTLTPFLILAAALFALGLFAVLERRGLVTLLIGIELMLNAAGLNFMAINHFCAPAPAIGQIITLFIIGLAAAEIAIAIALVLALNWTRRATGVDDLTELKG